MEIFEEPGSGAPPERVIMVKSLPGSMSLYSFFFCQRHLLLYDQPTKNFRLGSCNHARSGLGSSQRVCFLSGSKGLRRISAVPPIGYSNTFHGRRGDRTFLSVCDSEFPETGWEHPSADPNHPGPHMHGDNHDPMGIF